jgi:uncharacterized sulfatase
MRRRDFLRNMLAGAGLLAAPGFTFAGKQKRPNILFIMSDDHTAQAIGAYNMRLAPLDPTPNLDIFAKESMLFENCFCNNSICTPSRASIMTGQYPQTNGVRIIGEALPSERHYLPIEMKKLGYQTAVIGKWHLANERKAAPQYEPNFDYYFTLPGQGKYYNPEFYEKGKGDFPNNKVAVGTNDNKVHSTDAITDSALNWFKNIRQSEEPFFLCLHYKAPHDMFEFAARYKNYLADTHIPEPDSLFDKGNHGSVATRGENDSLAHIIGSSVGKRNVIRNMGGHMKIDKNLPDKEYAKQAYQEYMKRYLRCVKGVDDNLKRVFDYLKRAGLYDNTVIMYTGDQGFYLGEHDYIDKRWPYEESMRMPLFVRYPKLVKAGSRTDALVNNTDFAPTMIDLAGGDVPGYMQGRSLKAILKGKTPKDWRTATYYRYWMHVAHNHNNPAHFAIRTKEYKLIFYYGVDTLPPESGELTEYAKRINKEHFDKLIKTPPAWELYDMINDPQEMNNIYDDPKYKLVVKKLKAQLKTLRKELNETDDNYPHIQKIIDDNWD